MYSPFTYFFQTESRYPFIVNCHEYVAPTFIHLLKVDINDFSTDEFVTNPGAKVYVNFDWNIPPVPCFGFEQCLQTFFIFPLLHHPYFLIAQRFYLKQYVKTTSKLKIEDSERESSLYIHFKK